MRQRSIRRDDDALRVHGAATGTHLEAAVARGADGLGDGAALEDAHAALGAGTRERPHPARRVHRGVGRREHADATGPPHDRRQVGLVDPFGGQAIGAHRRVLGTRVLHLVRPPGDAQATDAREVTVRPDCVGDLVDPLL